MKSKETEYKANNFNYGTMKQFDYTNNYDGCGCIVYGIFFAIICLILIIIL